MVELEPACVPEPLTLEPDVPGLAEGEPVVPEPGVEGEVMPVEPVVPEDPEVVEPETEEPGETDPEVLGDAEGDPLSEIPAICIAC